MKHKCKALGIFALVCFLTYLYGCQKEEFEIEQPKAVNGTSFQVEVPAFESYYVPEALKGKLVDRLFKALGYVTRTGGNVTESDETGIGTILTDEILAVQDNYGTKYTFKLDHPEKDFYTFFNLVMVDRGDDVIVLLKKYIMTEEFATLYRSDQKSVDDFRGSVATTRLTNPCLCEFPDDGEPVPVYPGDYTPGGSGGTVSGDGPSGSDDSPGGQDGGGPIITYCFLISFTIETVTGTHVKIKRYTLNTCTGEIIQHNKAAKKSKQGNNQTETYNENDCCNEGVVGILDGSNQNSDPCKELKNLAKPELANIKPKIDYLKTKVLENKEFGKDFKNVGEDYFSFESTQPQNGFTIEHNIGGFFYGAAHTHPFFSSYAMFSWGDVKLLSDLYQNVHPSKADKVFYTLVCMKKVGTSWEPWTYTIKIDDPVKLKNKLNSVLANTFGANDADKTDKLNEILGKKFNSNWNDLESAFLANFQNYGISLYDTNDDLTQWNKIHLVQTQVTPGVIQLSTFKTPCN